MKKLTLVGVMLALLVSVCVPVFAQDAAAENLKNTAKKEKIQSKAEKKQAKQEEASTKLLPCPSDQYLMYNVGDPAKEVTLPVTYELKAAGFAKASEDAAAHWLFIYAQKESAAPADTDAKDWVAAAKVAQAAKAEDTSFLPKLVTLRVYKKDDISDEQKRSLSVPEQDAKQEVRYTVLSRESKTAVLAVPVAQAKQELKGFGGAYFPPERTCGDAELLQQAAPSGL